MPLIGQGGATPAGARRIASVYCQQEELSTQPNAPPGAKKACLVGHIFVSNQSKYKSTIEPWEKGNRCSFPILDGDWGEIGGGVSWGQRYDQLKQVEDEIKLIQALFKELAQIEEHPAGAIFGVPTGQPSLAQGARVLVILRELNERITEIERLSGATFDDPGLDGDPGSPRIALMERLRGILLLFGNPQEGPDPIPPAGVGTTEAGGGSAAGNLGTALRPIIFNPFDNSRGYFTMKGKRFGPVTVTWELIGARSPRPGSFFPPQVPLPGNRAKRLKLTVTPSNCFIQIIGGDGTAIKFPTGFVTAAGNLPLGFDVDVEALAPGLFPAPDSVPLSNK